LIAALLKAAPLAKMVLTGVYDASTTSPASVPDICTMTYVIVGFCKPWGSWERSIDGELFFQFRCAEFPDSGKQVT
jgi:hypothetical protein